MCVTYTGFDLTGYEVSLPGPPEVEFRIQIHFRSALLNDHVYQFLCCDDPDKVRDSQDEPVSQDIWTSRNTYENDLFTADITPV